MNKNNRGLMVLFSLILVVIPMVLFPERLGLPLAGSAPVYMLYELVYYGVVYYFLRHETPLLVLTMGAALTLVYRMAIGAVFGLSVIIMYRLDSGIAFSLGMTKYLPAVLLHVAAAPLVMRPLYLHLARQMMGTRGDRRPVRPEPESRPVSSHATVLPATPLAMKTDRVIGAPRHSSETHFEATPAAGMAWTAGASTPAEENQFERAVQYIGESGAIRLVLIVDDEGLPLARFNRGREDVELWAPLTVILPQTSRRILTRFGRDDYPEKIDLGTRNARIILRRIEHVTLMVLADKDIDETIHIRLAQASEMIRKYMNDRYSPAMFARVEEHYVSNS